MGDFHCNFLDSPSFNGFSLCIPCHSLPKSPFPTLPTHPSHHPRRRRKPPRLIVHSKFTSPSNSSPDLQLVSTTECSDGSILFRFGDPSEVAENVDLEEPKVPVRRPVGESSEHTNIVKVLDGNHERQAIVKEEREVRRESSIKVAKSKMVKNMGIGVCTKESTVALDTIDSGVEQSDLLLEDTVLEEVLIEVTDSSSHEAVHDFDICRDSGSSESTSTMILDVVDSEVELNDTSVEDTQETVLPTLDEPQIEVSDSCSSKAAHFSDNNECDPSSFRSVPEESSERRVHTVEGFLENNREENAGPVSVSKLDRESNVEKNGLVSEEIFEENSEEETLPSSTVSEGNSILDVPSTFAYEENIKRNSSAEVSHLPRNAENHAVEASMAYKNDEVIREVNVIGTMPLSNLVDAEPVLDERASYDASAIFIGTNGSESLEKVDNSTHNMTLEGEKTANDAQNTDFVEVSGQGTVEKKKTQCAVKREEISTARYFISSGASLLLQPFKALTGREDAYFVAEQNWLGVADGGGEWSLEGIKEGIYPLELMENCRKIVSEDNSISATNPKEVLYQSALETKSCGSSTILVAHFDGQVLHVANIGDSGFIVLRDGVVYKKSSPRFYEFNFPLQLKSGDDPSEVVEGYSINLDENDVIVIATDGLFDNLYDQEIASTVSKSLQSDLSPKEIAEVLAMRAQEVGSSKTIRSPFADAAQAAGYTGVTGGKLDDVTVIVSVVKRRSNPRTE